MYVSSGHSSQYIFYNPIDGTSRQCYSLEEYNYYQEKLNRQTQAYPIYITNYDCATTCSGVMMGECSKNKKDTRSLIAYYYNRKK